MPDLTEDGWVRRAERARPIPPWKLQSLLLEERQAIDDITADMERVVYTGGAWVHPTTGTFPNNYAHGGPAWDKASTEKAVMVLWVPDSWETVDVGILALAENFGSGNVRLRLGSEDGDDDVVVAVAAAYVGVPAFATPLTWTPGSGGFAGLQFAQFPLCRVGGDVTDTLDDDLAILSVVCTPGD